MVFTVRCFKCGQESVRLVLGGRAILHARCHGCNSNLLAEVLELEEMSRQPARVEKAPKFREDATREVCAEEETEMMETGAE